MNTVYELTAIKQCTYYKFSNLWTHTWMAYIFMHRQLDSIYLLIICIIIVAMYIAIIVFYMDLEAIYHLCIYEHTYIILCLSMRK